MFSGSYTASTKIKGNSLTDIIPVDLLGTPFSVGIQAQFSADLEIMHNTFGNVGVSANLPACTGTMSGNTYGENISSFLSTSTITFFAFLAKSFALYPVTIKGNLEPTDINKSQF